MLRRSLQVRNGADPFEDVNRLFDELLRGWSPGLTLFHASEPALKTFNPTVDITEDEKAYHLSAELPGMDEKDMEVSIEGDVLTIRGEKRAEKEDNGKNYYRMERSYGAFHRAIPLPAEVEQEKVEASFKKGVLAITMPKTAVALQHAKKIAVKAE